MAFTVPSQEFTDAEMLRAVRSAIFAILAGGQSVQFGRQSLTRADLKQLREMEGELVTRIDVAGGDSSIVLVQYGDRV